MITDEPFQEGVFELSETAEVLTLEKSARVIEEVTVSVAAADRTEIVRETVRRTEVDVEQL